MIMSIILLLLACYKRLLQRNSIHYLVFHIMWFFLRTSHTFADSYDTVRFSGWLVVFPTSKCLHTHTHTHNCMINIWHSLTLKHTHSNTHTQTHIMSRARTHTYNVMINIWHSVTLKHTHTHIHTHNIMINIWLSVTLKHTHTHTHTHTQCHDKNMTQCQTQTHTTHAHTHNVSHASPSNIYYRNLLRIYSFSSWQCHNVISYDVVIQTF